MVLEIAVGALVAAAVKLVVEGAAKKVGEEGALAGLKLLGWMRNKLTGRAKEAFEDLVKNPSSGDNQADLRKQLAMQLKAQPELEDQLRSLIPADIQAAAQQTLNQEGDHNIGVLVGGGINTVRVSH